MGRPPKLPAEKQGARVVVNMTKSEKRRLEMEARKAGMSLSAFLLNCWQREG